MSNNPLAEVFGFPISNNSRKAKNYRINKLCPFGNIVPNCTKDKADDPLGVCSVNCNGQSIITCPVRFREDWVIIQNAVDFAFPNAKKWTSLSEVKLLDRDGRSAGNIDYVVLKLDDDGNIIDFASVEVQGVYISGNLRNSFNAYMKDPKDSFEWNGRNYPHPDYLSSSRKRLIPQMLYKGGIFKSWNKKQCVVIQEEFYDTLPDLKECSKENADIAWFLYDLVYNEVIDRYELTLKRTVYTEFSSALHTVITPKPGDMQSFVVQLQEKLDSRTSVSPKIPGTILDIK